MLAAVLATVSRVARSTGTLGDVLRLIHGAADKLDVALVPGAEIPGEGLGVIGVTVAEVTQGD